MDELPEMAGHSRKAYEVPAGFVEIRLKWRLLFLYNPETGILSYKYGNVSTEFDLAEYAAARMMYKDARGFIDIRIHGRLVCKYRAKDTMIWYRHSRFDAEFRLSDYVAGKT